MLKGFELQTQPLTDYEAQVLVPVVARGLAAKRGRANAVTSKHIVDCLTAKGFKIDGIRLRKVVNYIRIKGIVKCLIATSNGYYVAENRRQIQEYTDSLRGREESIHAVRAALTEQMVVVYVD
jgi:carbamoylphosphate synthase small subunit